MPGIIHATCYYACPLLADASDTTDILVTPPAWLEYSYKKFLGENLPFGKLDTRQQDFLSACATSIKRLNLEDFTYLVKDEHISNDLNQAVHASRFTPYNRPALVLLPAHGAFVARGLESLRWAIYFTLGGSFLIVFLLLMMPLRPGAWIDT